MKVINKLDYSIKSLLSIPEFIYYLGYLWADGTVRKNRNTVALEIKSIDMDCILPIFKKFMYIKNVTNRQRLMKSGKLSNQLSCLSVSSQEFNNFLTSCDFHKRKFGSSPDILINQIPDNLLKHFFHGYFDGDGCLYFKIGSRTTSLCFWSNYNQNWSFLKTLCDKLDIRYVIKRASNKKNQKYSFLSIHRKHSMKRFYEYIQSHISGLERKKKIFIDLIQSINFIEKNLDSSHKGMCKSLRGWIVRKSFKDKRITLGVFKDKNRALKVLNFSKNKSIEEIIAAKANKFNDDYLL